MSSRSNTSIILPRQKSRSLAVLDRSPPTVCATCRHGLWLGATSTGRISSRATVKLSVYCRVMTALIDQWLVVCDGWEERPLVKAKSPIEG